MKKSIRLALSSLIAVLAPPTIILTYSHPVGAAEFSDQIDSIEDYLTDIPGQEPLREDYWEDDYLIDLYPLPLPDEPIYYDPIDLIDHTDIPGQEPLREDYWKDDYLIDHYPLPLPDEPIYYNPIYLIDHYPLPLPDGPIYYDPIYEYFPSENGTVDRTLCINCRNLFSDPVPLSTSIPEPSNLLGYIILGGVILGGAIKSKGK